MEQNLLGATCGRHGIKGPTEPVLGPDPATEVTEAMDGATAPRGPLEASTEEAPSVPGRSGPMA